MQNIAIAEGRLKQGNDRYTIQIVRSSTQESDGPSSFYIFNGSDPRTGTTIKDVPLEEISALMWYFRKDTRRVADFFSQHQGEKLELSVLKSDSVHYEKKIKLVKLHPAYEPFILPTLLKSQEAFMLSQNKRVLEFVNLLGSLGYQSINVDELITSWNSNSVVHRLAKPVVGSDRLAHDDMRYCPPGDHYWETRHGRKFYIGTPFEDRPAEITCGPTEACSDHGHPPYQGNKPLEEILNFKQPA